MITTQHRYVSSSITLYTHKSFCVPQLHLSHSRIQSTYTQNKFSRKGNLSNSRSTYASNLADNDIPAPEVEYPPGFFPDEQLVTEISTKLQVHKSWVIQGIYYTQKHFTGVEPSKDDAFAWVLENHHRFIEVASSNDGASSGEETRRSEAETKMVFVVNGELQMSPGKMAAQVAHGAIELYAKLSSDNELLAHVHNWMETGATKVVVKCKDTEQLFDLKDDAGNAGLKYAQICDAGLTEVVTGSVTCLAIFGPSAAVNLVTGSLPLL